MIQLKLSHLTNQIQMIQLKLKNITNQIQMIQSKLLTSQIQMIQIRKNQIRLQMMTLVTFCQRIQTRTQNIIMTVAVQHQICLKILH
ncbi:hypothetical protein RhiirA5_366777, partial [Rhizophagus irregularis]